MQEQNSDESENFESIDYKSLLGADEIPLSPEETLDHDETENPFFKVAFKKQRFTNPALMIERLQRDLIPCWIRRGTECTQVIIDDTQITYTSTKNFPRAKLFLFNNVRRDVEKWIDGRKDITMPPETVTTHYNIDYDDSHGTIVGTDLNHAYWRIAYVKGIISEKSYEHGLVPDNTNVAGKIKALRLATLSVLGREKSFDQWENGVIIKTIITQEERPILKKVYKYIRLICYNMMNELAQKLGDDFESWKTDCIYYRDTPENRKLVEDYFDRRKMTYKILDYFEPEIPLENNADVPANFETDLPI